MISGRFDSDVEQEVDNVAVFHDVLLALASKKPLRLGVCQRAAGFEIVECDDLGTDEATLKIGVDLAGSLRRLGAALDGPRTAFVASSGQEGDQPEQAVAALDQTVEAGLLKSKLLHEHGLFIRIVELGNVGLELGADRQDLTALALGELFDGDKVAARFGVVYLVFAEICGVDGFAERQKVARGDECGVVRAALKRAGEIALVHVVAQRGKDLDLVVEALVTALCVFLSAVDAAVDHLKIRHDELGVDDLNVAQRVGRAFDVGDVRVFKAAHNVHDRVAAADVGQKLVAETLALGRAFDKTCDVNKLDDGRRELFGIVLVAQPFEPLVRHGHDADVRVDGAEGVVVRGDPRVGDGIKERGFSDIRKPNDT